tara:strand:+ start:8892 stop:9935 length:1044 start_codon:yes stop_codon:yes gene_type:complete
MNKKLKIEFYKILHLIRFSQEYLIKKYHPEDEMRCPIHFCLGQEVLAACLNFFLEKKDFLLSHHRSHGYYLAKKCPVEQMIYEFYGKAKGSNSGLAGSQELSYSPNNFFSGTILSGMFSIALGTSFAQKINKKKNISVTVIGDGGMEEGIVYETLNLASLKSLPILFICENNNYSVHTNIHERTLTSNFKNKVKSFQIKYINISEYKADIIFSKVKDAVSYVRNKKKPVFLEFNTMRTCGHVGPEDDDAEHNYRKKDLLKWKNKDSFKWFKQKLIKNGYLKTIERIEKSNKNRVRLAAQKARKEKFLNYNKSVQFNFINTYSKIVKKFSNPSKNFAEKQKETKLNPY